MPGDFLADLSTAVGELSDAEHAVGFAGCDDGLEGFDGIPRLEEDRFSFSIDQHDKTTHACLVDDSVLLGLESFSVDRYVALRGRVCE